MEQFVVAMHCYSHLDTQKSLNENYLSVLYHINCGIVQQYIVLNIFIRLPNTLKPFD